jgi:hypothetical protein
MKLLSLLIKLKGIKFPGFAVRVSTEKNEVFSLV